MREEASALDPQLAGSGIRFARPPIGFSARLLDVVSSLSLSLLLPLLLLLLLLLLWLLEKHEA